VEVDENLGANAPGPAVATTDGGIVEAGDDGGTVSDAVGELALRECGVIGAVVVAPPADDALVDDGAPDAVADNTDQIRGVLDGVHAGHSRSSDRSAPGADEGLTGWVVSDSV